MTEWFEDEAHWRDSAHVAFNSAKLAAGAADVERVVELARFQGGAVLDLCCGPGRLTVPLAAKGYEVTGVDLTECLLAQGQARAAEAGVSITWTRQDMRHYVQRKSFGLAICLYVSFGYFEDRADDRRVLRNVFESLVPGGAFVLECAGKESLALQFQTHTGFETADGATVFMRRRLCDDWNRTVNEWLVVEGAKVRKFWYALNLYSGQEIKTQLLEAGFASVSLHGNLAGDPYDHEATTLIAVARKAP